MIFCKKRIFLATCDIRSQIQKYSKGKLDFYVSSKLSFS